jgi:lipopolysaccharide biosynthesis regulator YciM
MTEWLAAALALFVAAGAGAWWGRRGRSAQGGASAEESGPPSAYYRGLYYLLNEQPEQAVQAFLDVAQVEPESVEAHLALGNLFRRQGETERALRIHQNLTARPNLSREQLDHAMYQLALDYQKAGLFDRARQVFHELVERNRDYEPAVASLTEIAEQERDWEDALKWRRHLQRIRGHSDPVAESLIQCEIAAEALGRNDLSRAQQAVRKAFSIDPACVRASVLSGQVHALKGNDRKAIAAWEKIIRQAPEYLSLVLDELVAAHHRLGESDQLRQFLVRSLESTEHPGVLAALGAHLALESGADEAMAYLVEPLRRHPDSAELVSAYLGMWKDRNREAVGTCEPLLEAVQPYLDRARSRQSRFVCRNCGFKSAYMQWKCPQCRSWGTLYLRPA